VKFSGRNKNTQENSEKPESAQALVTEQANNSIEQVPPTVEVAETLEFTETGADVENQIDQAAEQILDSDTELLQIIEEQFHDDFEKMKVAFGVDGDEKVERAKSELLKKIKGEKGKSKILNALKFAASRLTLPALAGAGIRSLIKNSARAYLGTISLGASIGIGAGIGGTFAAIETYRKERLKVDKNDVLKQIDEAIQSGENMKLAAVIDQGRKDLKSGKFTPLENNFLKVKLQKAELSLRLNLKPELQGEHESVQFLAVLDESQSSRKALRKHEGLKNQKLDEKIKFETYKNPEFKKKMAINVGIGMAAGAFGGAVGHGLHALLDTEMVRGFFGLAPSGSSAEKTTQKLTEEAQKALKVSPGQSENLVNGIETLGQEVSNAKKAELIEQAQKELLAQKFTTLAEKGEGATHAARDLVHDYLVNKTHISGGKFEELSPEQTARLAFAEDSIMKQHFLDQTAGKDHIVSLGQKFELTGEQIENALDKANALTPEQLENINKLLQSPDHKFSEKTLDLFRSEELGNSENNFYKDLTAEVQTNLKEAIADNKIDTVTLQAEIEATIAEEVAASPEVDRTTTPTMSTKKVVTATVVGAALAILLASGGVYLRKKYFSKKNKQNPDGNPIENTDEQIVEQQQLESNNEISDSQNFSEKIAERFGVQIEISQELQNSSAEKLQLYEKSLPGIFAKFPEVFEGQKIIFTDGGINTFKTNIITLNFSEYSAIDNIQLLTDFAEATQGSNNFKKHIRETYKVEVEIHPSDVINAERLFPAVASLLREYPDFFKNQRVMVSNYASDYDRKGRLFVNLNEPIEGFVERFEQLIYSKTKPETKPETEPLPTASSEAPEARETDFFSKNKIEIHNSVLDGRTLTVEDLKNAGLEPVHELKIGETEIQLSKPFKLGSTRLGVTAYVKSGDKYVARSYYRSNSAGVWRNLPGYLTDGKGKLIYYDKAIDQRALTLPSEIQQSLAQLSEQPGNILELADAPFLFAGTSRDLKTLGSDEERTVYFEVNKGPVKIAGLENESDKKIDPEKIEITDPKKKPNFGKLVSSWKQSSSVYTKAGETEGIIEIELYESEDGSLRYMFCNDELGRAWLSGIETTGPVGSTGLRKEWIEGGDINTPAFEYAQESGKFGNPNLRKDGYVDMFKNYISKIPLIQEYLAHKKTNSLPEIPTNPANNPVEQKQEISALDVSELDQQAKARGFNPVQTRVWFDIMRSDGGLLNKAVGVGKPLTQDEANFIRDTLGSIQRFRGSIKEETKESKLTKLTGIFEILLPKYSTLQKEDPQRGYLDSIRGNLKKIDKNLFKSAEETALKNKKLDRKKLGIK
jgi:hypothetical protein